MSSSTKKTLAEYKAPYPAPTADQKRLVIFLDERGAEEKREFKLQLIPGRVETVDATNRHFIAGDVKEETINGWGYTYYVVHMGELAGTLMTSMPGDTPKPRFVAMVNKPLIPYNSKLPVVVYVPKDAELHYRVWAPTKAEPDCAQEA
ncbi:ecotin [Trypanosoma grayi]|uniref:ecotin n=1 Tax=Trypanosoma grayi TaxID=71804 RepID=UPI0004F46C4F|nr:ecotin [Trypanosoma grayi]KEG10546.1 ecotin [Trypanosoma grayi]